MVCGRHSFGPARSAPFRWARRPSGWSTVPSMTAPDPQTVRPGPIGAVPIGATPPFDAVIFDMDGVVTDTASLHAAAWKELFDGVLADPRAAAQGRLEPFDADLDYRPYVDGRAREDGVAGFLAARGVSLPAGTPDDPPDAWTVWRLAIRKNELFLTQLSADGVRVFEGTIDLMRRHDPQDRVRGARPQGRGDHPRPVQPRPADPVGRGHWPSRRDARPLATGRAGRGRGGGAGTRTVARRGTRRLPAGAARTR
jgi:hypothetical protein